MATKIADDVKAIREGLKRLEAEKAAAVNGPIAEVPATYGDLVAAAIENAAEVAWFVPFQDYAG